MRILAKATDEEVSAEAARIVAGVIRDVPTAALCLPAGRTPRGMYRELVRLHQTEGLDFSQARIFQLDEYLGLPADHPGSFESYLWREFLNHVNARREHINFIHSGYEDDIRNAGGIDMVILGIGANGHLAFNEPGSAADSRTRIVKLADSTIEGMRHAFKKEELPLQATTVGLGTILEARRILLLASGREKAAILAKALREPVNPDVPASILQMHSDVTVIADTSALAHWNIAGG